MKKTTALPIAFVIAFAAWTLYLHNKPASNSDLLSAETTAPQPIALTQSSSQIATTAPTTKKQPVTTPTPATTPKKPVVKGQYTDGTYTGDTADAYYGNLQVAAVISNGRLADIKFLQYPSDRSTSRRISGMALPILRQEAVQSQSANVDTVSGATDVSGAFRESLASALDQARA